jgi:hypothetical protein
MEEEYMTSARVGLLAAGLILASGAVDGALAQSKAEIQNMDRNGDGIVTRAEWQGEGGAFRLHDTNKDGVLSGTEVWDEGDARRRGRSPSDTGFDGRLGRFRDYDTNNDGVIVRSEWHDQSISFRAMDRNRDNRISRDEFRAMRDEIRGAVGTSGVVPRSNAYRAGYERGQIEGRLAGREDRDRNQGWDLEGQRELESADSGYEPRFGPKSEYQTGYREGFRATYGEGWNRR